MNVLIVGPGGVGAYFVRMLSHKGADFRAVVSSFGKHSTQIAAHGLRVITSVGESIIPSDYFSKALPLDSSQDVVLISIKQPNLDVKLIEGVLSSIKAHGIIAIISNGLPFYFPNGLSIQGKTHLDAVDPGGWLQQMTAAECIVGVLPVIASHISEPGVVNINRPLNKISVTIGSPENTNCNLDRVEHFTQLLREAGLNIIVTKNLHLEILKKEQFSLAVLTQSALFNKTLGEIYESQEYHPFMKYSIELVNYLAQQLGIGALRSYEEMMAIPITKAHYASMCTDINEDKIPEVKVILHTVMELADHFEVPCTKPMQLMNTFLQNRIDDHMISALQMDALQHASAECFGGILPVEEL
jgi:ketopantoate reductase